MARIAGVDLPNKRIVVALTYIYGIGQKKAKKIIIEGVSNSKCSMKSFFSEKKLIYQEIRRIPIYSNNYLFQGLHGRRGYTNKGHLISQNLMNLELTSINSVKNKKFCQIDRDSFEISSEMLEELGMQTIKLPNLSIFENILVFLGVILESICFFYIPSNLTNGIFIILIKNWESELEACYL